MSFVEITFESDSEEVGGVEVIKNKCEECGKRSRFNYEDMDYGVRCNKHKLKDMVNILVKNIVNRDLKIVLKN